MIYDEIKNVMRISSWIKGFLVVGDVKGWQPESEEGGAGGSVFNRAATLLGEEARVAALGHARGAPCLAFIGARAGQLAGPPAPAVADSAYGRRLAGPRRARRLGRRRWAGAGQAYGLGPLQEDNFFLIF
jgi:hypothetical protein